MGTSKKWIEAIESGKYVFGAGQLREESPQGDLYCALGVLADFVNPEGWKPHIIHGYQHDGEVFKLSADVAKRCKMKSVWFIYYRGWEGNRYNDGLRVIWWLGSCCLFDKNLL